MRVDKELKAPDPFVSAVSRADTGGKAIPSVNATHVRRWQCSTCSPVDEQPAVARPEYMALPNLFGDDLRRATPPLCGFFDTSGLSRIRAPKSASRTSVQGPRARRECPDPRDANNGCAIDTSRDALVD